MPNHFEVLKAAVHLISDGASSPHGREYVCDFPFALFATMRN